MGNLNLTKTVFLKPSGNFAKQENGGLTMNLGCLNDNSHFTLVFVTNLLH